MARLLLVVAAALILCGVAGAGTIQDLTNSGYTVSISNPGPSGANCPTYFISGHGVQTYMNCNTPQADIDSLANPVTICNADWQINHPDQLAAFQSITGKGWTISGDQCADVYTVTNPNDGSTAYSGPGAGLPGFDAQNDAPAVPQGNAPTSSSGSSSGGSCLPLCPNPGDTRGAGGIVIPATSTSPAQTLTASSTVAPITDPSIAPAAAAILFPDRSTGYLERAGFGSGGALTP